MKDGTHGTHKTVKQGPWLLSAKNIDNNRIVIKPNDRKISENAFQKIHKNFQLHKGDVLLTIVGTIGRSAILTKTGNLTFQRSVAYLRPNNGILDPGYLLCLTKSVNFQKQLKRKVVVSAQPGIYLNDISRLSVAIPNNKSEQNKISNLLERINDLLSLQHKKLEQLRLLKKAMLQQLFPDKDGKLQSRFNGFTNVWEQRKLGEMVEFIGTGKSKYKHKNVGAYKILGSTGVIGFDNTYDYNGNFILTARVGANAGTLYKYSGKVKITDNTVFIQGTQLNFTYYLLNNFNLKRLSFGSGQPLIKASELKKLKLYFPIVLEEKEKIGMALSKLDTLIARHQRKLDHLQLLKKFLLQKMFI